MNEQTEELRGIDESLPFADEAQEEVGPELSPELLRLGNIKDDAEPGEPEPDKKHLSVAAGVAGGALKGAEWAITKWLGVNTGLSDEEKAEWAGKVAPALVKMGVTDYTGFFDRYKDYITAIFATYTLGEKITDNVMAQLAEKAAEAERKAEAAENQPKESPEPMGLDGYDRDLATQGKLLAGA